MNRVDADLEELLDSFFAAEFDAPLVADVERTGAWPEAAWKRAQGIDLPRIGIPEAAGGAGGRLADVAAVVRHAAFHAAPLPLLEHHVGSWLLAEAGLDRIDGPLTFAGLGTGQEVTVDGDRVSGRLANVPWGSEVHAVVVLARDVEGKPVVSVFDGRSQQSRGTRDMAGTPLSTYELDGLSVSVGHVPDASVVRRRAEVLRCAAMAGLLDRVFQQTNRYAAERQQFGKPINRFQGVQAHLVHLAQAAAMSALAVDRAVDAVDSGWGELETAAAAAVVDDLAGTAVAAAHQAHGAIGMTREYSLQQATRRLQSWRQLWVGTDAAAEDLGRRAHAAPSFAAVVASHPEDGIGP